MGKKKQKEKDVGEEINPADPPSSDIFKTIFGDVEDQNQDEAVSIFSDNNPFRRGSRVVPPVENPTHVDSESHDIVEPNERKKSKKEKRSALDSPSTDPPMEAKKSKKERTQTLELDTVTVPNDLPSENKEAELNLGSELKKETKKNKRKRDELETEYEVKKYGAVPEPKAKTGGGEEGEGAKVGEKRKKVDDPAEMLVSKEGFDDESKLLRTVFVGNLPLKVKKKGLLKEFSQFGEVESVRIRSVPILDTKTPRKGAIRKKQINDAVDSVHAYIVFKTEQSAQASLTHNMAVVAGKHIRVDRACPPRKKLKGEQAPIYDNKRTVFVGNLPFDVKDEELYQLFCGINNLESSIEAVRVVRDPHSSVGKGIAYVLFKTRDAAHMVVKRRFLKLRDRDLRLSHARSDSTPSKRSNTSPGSASNYPERRYRADTRTPDSKYTADTKSPSAYQGMRASKSGVQKKAYPKSMGSVKPKFRSQSGEKPKERKGKRPSVAARKAKVLNDAPNQAGKKRKLESRTPDSSHRDRKVKKFK